MATEITLDELDAARAAGETVLDVRNPDEYAAGHVPGARLIPLDDLDARRGELPAGRVTVVCQSGRRSATAADRLTAAGVEARSVAGGTSAWVESGRAVQTGTA